MVSPQTRKPVEKVLPEVRPRGHFMTCGVYFMPPFCPCDRYMEVKQGRNRGPGASVTGQGELIHVMRKTARMF